MTLDNIITHLIVLLIGIMIGKLNEWCKRGKRMKKLLKKFRYCLPNIEVEFFLTIMLGFGYVNGHVLIALPFTIIKVGF